MRNVSTDGLYRGCNSRLLISTRERVCSPNPSFGGERIRHGAPLLIRQSKLGDRAVAISLLIAQLPRDASARTTAVSLSGLLALPLTAGWSGRKQAQKLSSASRGVLPMTWV